MNNNILHRFSKGIIACVAVVCLCACHDNFEDKGVPTLVVTPSTKVLEFTATASQAVTIETNRDWKAYLETPEDWLELSKTEGSGNDMILVTAAAGSKQESATLVIALYNQYGIMMSESISIIRNSDGTVEPAMSFDEIIFDGSELPTSYPTNESITIGEASFIVNQVANFTTIYGGTNNIQYHAADSYIYNTTALDIAEIQITLSSTYNNFTVYASTTEQPTATTGSLVTADQTGTSGFTVGDVITYVLPEGTIYFNIMNEATYTAYASEFKLVGNTTTEEE